VRDDLGAQDLDRRVAAFDLHPVAVAGDLTGGAQDAEAADALQR
jgi:hypothetical protein